MSFEAERIRERYEELQQAAPGVTIVAATKYVSVDDLDARVGEYGHVCERHVLRRRDDRDAVTHLAADALVVRADRLRRRSRSPPAAR